MARKGSKTKRTKLVLDMNHFILKLKKLPLCHMPSLPKCKHSHQSPTKYNLIVITMLLFNITIKGKQEAQPPSPSCQTYMQKEVHTFVKLAYLQSLSSLFIQLVTQFFSIHIVPPNAYVNLKLILMHTNLYVYYFSKVNINYNKICNCILLFNKRKKHNLSCQNPNQITILELNIYQKKKHNLFKLI